MSFGFKGKLTFLRELCSAINIIIIYRILLLGAGILGVQMIIYGSSLLDTILGAFSILISASCLGISFAFEAVSESKEFYSRLVQNISIIIRVIVGLFMIPIVVSVYFDNITLLQILGVFSDDQSVKANGLCMSLFTALTFIGFITYVVSFQKWVHLFYKNSKLGDVNSIDISFVIWGFIILTNAALVYLDILNDSGRYILTFISFIPLLSDALIVMISSLAICLLSIISRKSGEKTSPVKKSSSLMYSITDNNKEGVL